MESTLAEVDGSGPTPPRRPRRVLVAVVAGMAFVGLVAGAWMLVAAQQRSQVAVWFDAMPLECASATAPIEDLDIGFDPIYVQVVDASADLDCWLRVQVENRGRLPATIRRVVLPMYGPSTGGGIRARELSPLALQPAAEDEPGSPALDAIYTFDHRLEADDRLVLRIGLEHAPAGCMSPDSLAWLTDAPMVEVSVLRLRGTQAPTGVAFAQRGTQESSCDLP